MEIFKETFFIYAIISGILIAGMCSYIGIYIVLKRIVFIGLAMSEIAALGVALGLYLGWQVAFSAFAMVFLSIIFFWYRGKNQEQLPSESIISAIYIIAGALSTILISKNPLIETSGIDLIKGNILYTTTPDLWLLSILVLIVIITQIFLHKEFLFVSFDRETAHTTGLNTNLYEFILYLNIGIVVALSMRVGGILFVFGSMVIPPLISLTLFRKIKLVFLFSVIIAIISTIFGIIGSYFFDMPSTSTILCIYGIIFVFVNMYASKK